MAKKSPIGFNAALKDSEEKEIEKDESPEISRVDIDDIVEERVAREKDYEQHMNHYEMLCNKDNKRENIKNIFIVVLITLFVVLSLYNFYQYAYKKGALEQCKDKGPYQLVVDKNNKTHIIEK